MVIEEGKSVSSFQQRYRREQRANQADHRVTAPDAKSIKKWCAKFKKGDLKNKKRIGSKALGLGKVFYPFVSNNPDERDELFDEVVEMNGNLERLSDTEFDQLDVAGKWNILFKSKNIVQMKKLVSAWLSVLSSNSFCESVFSITKALWTEERNSFSFETVNSFVCVKSNSDFDCSNVPDYFLANTELVIKARGVEKYAFGD
uniref:HAT C-terminal dimerisation domain-containing protein n=1 Tax=Ditylenchus dipsaci TaxID=166011 RepID=A0A915E4L7_9BILA